MSAVAATATRPSVGWLLGMSSWMLLTLIPGAATTWLAFGIIGVISRRVRIIVLGAVFAGAAILASLDVWGPWRPIVGACVYLAGMLVALAVNPGWLRTMWERRVGARSAATGAAAAARTGSAARSRGGGARGSSSRQGSASTSSSSAGRKTSRATTAEKRAAAKRDADARAARDREAAEAHDAGADEAASLAAQVGARSDDLIAPRAVADAESADAAAASSEPVDVNTADAEALRTLPGISRARARAAVRAREENGGFVSVEAFGEAAGLQPHEIVRLRTVATCSPRPRGERRFGRRVDL